MLDSSLNGLSKKEANFRIEKFGFNEIKIKSVNFLEVFVRQIKSPFVYLLFAAAIVSMFIGQTVDSIAVISFVIINVVIGFIQEYKAEKSVFFLRKFIAKRVKIRRDGKEEIIDSKYLVPGDIVLLGAGDIIPADLRVISLSDFLVDESVLTGESAPVGKILDALKNDEVNIFGAENILFNGTTIISGRAEGIVINTAKETVLGEISKDISQIKKESSYEKSILYFSKLILRIVVVTIVLIFLANIAVKGFSSFWEIALFSVALIVSILPEALPAVVTFALSNGSMKLAKENVVVKRLSAIEDLGNIDILCTDKTGTLTQNKLSLQKAVSDDKKKLFLFGLLSSGAKNIEDKILNPFDEAILKRSPDDVLRQSKKYSIISDLPFDSYRMKSSFLVMSNEGEKFIISKGAPEKIIKSCSKFLGDFDKNDLTSDLAKDGMEGKRTLALAYKKIETNKLAIKPGDEKGLTFLGYFVFEDPLKNTAKEAVELSKKIGVKIKIITGDSKEVTAFVAKKMGLPYSDDDMVVGSELEKMVREDFEDACERCSIFARISPDLKHKIVRTLQKNYSVGFMGEGINDAPALKTANVGIAVLEASDVAREASDVVLLQKDLRVVINGIKDGRIIFANINKYIKCALASNFGNFYSIAAISIFVNYLPMLPVQILLGNLLSDFPLISVATDSVDVQELKKPKLYQLNNVLPLIISLAIVSTLFDFIFFAIFKNQSAPVIQTLWFIESILTEIGLIFIIRTRGVFYKAIRPGFWLLTLAILDGLFIVALPFLSFGQKWFHFVSPPIILLAIVLIEVFVYYVVSEFVKLIYFKHWKLNSSVVR